GGEGVVGGMGDGGEPIQGSVGVGIAYGFVQCGDQVVVLFAGFVIAKQLALENVFEEFFGDDPRSVAARLGSASGEFQRVVGGARIAVGVRGDAEENVVADS